MAPESLADVLAHTGFDLSADLAADLDEVLITGEAIRDKLGELAAEIDRDYAGRDVLLVGILKGAFVLIADLARHLSVPVSIDFMAVSSYGASTRTSGVVRILKDLDIDIEGRHVLLVEDIVDSGLTLNYLLRNLRSRQPASLEVLALLTKPSQRRIDLPIRYRGFEVPDVFVVGYGLDYDERFRNLPFVATLRSQTNG
ncbi:MAG: hypoxanthine phosphoribosyltransferase [Actinobacteria bacterium]|nr:hypoxanthine phosphoribosyltransferase [Actinomycetota bacterium]